MHILNDPSFFLTNKTGAPQGEELGLMKPFQKVLVISLIIPSFRMEPIDRVLELRGWLLELSRSGIPLVALEEDMASPWERLQAGSESRPPMLNKENYVPWSSRLLRYAKSRPNGKLIHNSILNGPYVRRMISEPGDANHEVTTILFGLPEDIYAAVDSCETAQEIWLRVQQMMKGSAIGIQEKKAKLIGVQGNGNPNQIGNGNLVAARAEGNAAGQNGNQIRSAEEAAKFVGDFKSLANEADASLAKHKALELEIERLLKAVVSQDIMNIVQKESVVDTSDLQTDLERMKERFKNSIIKKENEYAKLWNDWYKKCDECKYDKISYDKAYKDMQQKIKRLQAQLGDLKGKRVDNTKTRRPQPRSNTKHDRVPSASKSSRSKNKEAEVEEHHRNLLLSKNNKHISS
nr:hypothetical protein [Tanacetum cinerariifolium]